MKVLICDDLQSEIDKLAGLLKKTGLAASVAGFNNGAETLDFMRSGKIIDVCFLDIVMPEMSGIDLAKGLRGQGFSGEIVFLSTSREYGPETYGVGAFGYLLKPPTPESVREVLDKIACARKAADLDGINIKTKGGVRSLLFREISFAEVINHKIYFRMTNGESVEMTATFAEISPLLLRDGRFAQCHSSYIVNLNNIASIIGKEVIMRGGAKLPLSRSYAALKKKFMDLGLE